MPGDAFVSCYQHLTPLQVEAARLQDKWRAPTRAGAAPPSPTSSAPTGSKGAGKAVQVSDAPTGARV